MSNYIVTDSQLEDVADAIRAKSGGTSPLAFPSGFVSEIGNIPSGGGGITTLEVIQKLTLAENVRAVQVDIPSGYDWVYTIVKGEFAEENWLYWGINNTDPKNYQLKTTLLRTGFVATNRPSDGNGAMFGMSHSGSDVSIQATAPMSYLYIKGYSADIKAGTKIYTYGGKYANL